jgi:hypothetical protein
MAWRPELQHAKAETGSSTLRGRGCCCGGQTKGKAERGALTEAPMRARNKKGSRCGERDVIGVTPVPNPNDRRRGVSLDERLHTAGHAYTLIKAKSKCMGKIVYLWAGERVHLSTWSPRAVLPRSGPRYRRIPGRARQGKGSAKALPDDGIPAPASHPNPCR